MSEALHVGSVRRILRRSEQLVVALLLLLSCASIAAAQSDETSAPADTELLTADIVAATADVLPLDETEEIVVVCDEAPSMVIADDDLSERYRTPENDESNRRSSRNPLKHRRRVERAPERPDGRPDESARSHDADESGDQRLEHHSVLRVYSLCSSEVRRDLIALRGPGAPRGDPSSAHRHSAAPPSMPGFVSAPGSILLQDSHDAVSIAASPGSVLAVCEHADAALTWAVAHQTAGAGVRGGPGGGDRRDRRAALKHRKRVERTKERPDGRPDESGRIVAADDSRCDRLPRVRVYALRASESRSARDGQFAARHPGAPRGDLPGPVAPLTIRTALLPPAVACMFSGAVAHAAPAVRYRTPDSDEHDRPDSNAPFGRRRRADRAPDRFDGKPDQSVRLLHEDETCERLPEWVRAPRQLDGGRPERRDAHASRRPDAPRGDIADADAPESLRVHAAAPPSPVSPDRTASGRSVSFTHSVVRTPSLEERPL